VEELSGDKKKPVVVAGGSGLYLTALVDGFFIGEDIKDLSVRTELESAANEGNLDVLYKELQTKDPDYASITETEDRQRILRALEVIRVSGRPFSELHSRERDRAPFLAHWFGLDWPRDMLYGRIASRTDEMLDRGLAREVDDLLDRGYRNANALKSVGYEELIAWREGRLNTLDEAADLIRKNTRHYAKRQLTWFRADERIQWLDARRTVPELADSVLDMAGLTRVS
jgi:tRNA dimethylallyltransferase